MFPSPNPHSRGRIEVNVKRQRDLDRIANRRKTHVKRDLEGTTFGNFFTQRHATSEVGSSIPSPPNPQPTKTMVSVP